MALEDMTGTGTGLDAMVPSNPDGLDAKSEGDNHIRGIKNVILNSLGPMESAAVSLPVVGAGMRWDGTKYVPSGQRVKLVYINAPGAGNYSPPVGCVSFKVRLVGGGGSGWVAGPNGAQTTFAAVVAGGGLAPVGQGGGAGGLPSGGDLGFIGGGGGSGSYSGGVQLQFAGMSGGASHFGGGGPGGGGVGAAVGSGGNSYGAALGSNQNPSGGAGAYAEKIYSPAGAGPYAYSVAGAAAAGGAGGAGMQGVIIIEEYY